MLFLKHCKTIIIIIVVILPNNTEVLRTKPPPPSCLHCIWKLVMLGVLQHLYVKQSPTRVHVKPTETSETSAVCVCVRSKTPQVTQEGDVSTKRGAASGRQLSSNQTAPVCQLVPLCGRLRYWELGSGEPSHALCVSYSPYLPMRSKAPFIKDKFT